ncbi:MAG: hypothetical protein ACJ8HQ_02215 [Chthoniobacterales bacterium]
MAERQRPEKSIHDLRQEIAHSRDRLGRDLSGLGYELNFPLKFRKSFQRNSKLWAAGATLIGLVVTMRGGSKKKVVVEAGSRGKKGQEQKKGILEAGLAVGALRFAATLLRPMVVSYVTKKVGSYAGRTR